MAQPVRLKCSCVLLHFQKLKTTHENILPKILRILLCATCGYYDDEQKLDAPLKFRLNSQLCESQVLLIFRKMQIRMVFGCVSIVPLNL